jgi:hypothetical protein
VQKFVLVKGWGYCGNWCRTVIDLVVGDPCSTEGRSSPELGICLLPVFNVFSIDPATAEDSTFLEISLARMAMIACLSSSVGSGPSHRTGCCSIR